MSEYSTHSSRRLVLPMLTLGSMLALGSCAHPEVSYNREAMIPVPPRWQQGPALSRPLDTVALAKWWERFHDPILNELIGDALNSSRDMRSALAKIREFRARRALEEAALYPSISADLSASKSRSTNTDSHVTTKSTLYAASLDATWQIDLFGRQFQTLKAASADLAQNEENYYGAQVSLAAEVATAYVNLRSAEAQLAVVQKNLGTREETARITQWREEAGTGSALDTQQSLSALEQARALIPALQLSIAQARNQIALLAGRAPGAMDSLLAKSREVPAISLELAAGIPSETLRQRPDIRAAERGVEAAFARTRAAQRQRLPSLNLSGSIGFEALKAGRLFDPETTVANALGSLTAPLFDAGRIRAMIRIQGELGEQAVDTYETKVLTALSEVENALVAVQRHAERLSVLNKATSAEREAVSFSTMQYQAGQIDLLVSLDAQRTLLTLEQAEVTSTADRTIAFIELYKALGGGWTPL